MKSERMFALFITVSMLLLPLISCSVNSTGISTATTTENSENSGAAIQIGRMTDDILSKYDSYYEYRDDSQGDRILIWTDRTVNNFDFISVGFENAGNSPFLVSKNILYSLDKLTREKPFAVEMLVSEGIPSRGITFLDENNIKRYFYINENGIDGSLSLVEFNNYEENNHFISAQEALDIVKNYLNDNGPELFEPLNDANIYYYKNSNIMIQHDAYYDDELYGKHHIIHEYEIVIDDPDTDEGHTATYNWYRVDALTGNIIPMFNKDFTLNPDYEGSN